MGFGDGDGMGWGDGRMRRMWMGVEGVGVLEKAGDGGLYSLVGFGDMMRGIGRSSRDVWISMVKC